MHRAAARVPLKSCWLARGVRGAPRESPSISSVWENVDPLVRARRAHHFGLAVEQSKHARLSLCAINLENTALGAESTRCLRLSEIYMWHDAVEGVGQRRAWGKHALSLSRGCHGKQSEFNTAGRSVSPLDYGRLGAANLELEFFLAFTRVIPFTVDSKFPLQLWAMAHGPHGLSLVSGLCLSVPFAFVLLVAIPRSYLFLARPQQSLSNNERTLCVLWHFQHGEQDGALIRKIWNIQIMYSHIRYYSMNKNIEIRLSKGALGSVSV